MPFGDRRREEVLDEAAAELVQKVLHVSGKHVEVKFFIASIKNKIDGLSGGISWASCPIPAYLRRL
ncbi:MAG TPA: hypothetical protein GX510_02370 [Firmicutes bacterium]|nr:hypothetical protein [Candidatus Fermentithermobacillaceae bacterium]